MKRRPSGLVWLAACLTLVVTASIPSTARTSPGRVEVAASSLTTQVPAAGEGTTTVPELARRCIDARHVALVSNGLRRGRTFTPAEARGWCDDRSAGHDLFPQVRGS